MATSEKWELRLSESAEAEVSDLPSDIRSQLLDAILDLEEDPFPPDAIPLRGWNDLQRIRVEGYRIVYRVNRQRRTVLVERVRPRGVAYLGLD